jgi:hypothetical protein
MSAFMKTLFGDRRTVTVVALVMAAELLLITIDHAAAASLVIPTLVLAGAGWLARK